MEHGRALREAAVAVGVFGPPVFLTATCYGSGVFQTPSLSSVTTGHLLHHNQLAHTIPMSSSESQTNCFSILEENVSQLQKKKNICKSVELSSNAVSTSTNINERPIESSFLTMDKSIEKKSIDESVSSLSSTRSSRENDNDDDSIDVTYHEEPVNKETNYNRFELSQLIAPNLYPSQQETVYETSARLLLMAVKWAKNLPSFGSLSSYDQVLLLEESWSELFLLNAFQWCIPLDSKGCALFSVVEHCNNRNEIKINNVSTSKDKVATDVNTLHEVYNKYKAVQVDPAEFACLKAIVLFRPESRGLKDPAQIENLQDQAHVMLAQHTEVHFADQTARFGRLLLMLPLLRTINSLKIESIFFQRTIGNTPMEKVLCDMYKN